MRIDDQHSRSTNLTANVTDPQLDVFGQHLVAVLRRPVDVVAMIIDAVFALGLLEDTIIRRLFVLNHIRLEVEGFAPEE